MVAQKIQGGSLADKAEVVLEVAEAAITELHVDGSLRVTSDSVMGGSEDALAVNYNQIRSRHDLQLHQQSSRGLWYALSSCCSASTVSACACLFAQCLGSQARFSLSCSVNWWQ